MSASMKTPFNKPFMTGKELAYIEDAHTSLRLAGDGQYTRKCVEWLRKNTGSAGALLAHSCTGALEMAALLLDIRPGDEIIMPSYTFVSTANAFTLRGGVPVFVDIRSDTLNIDETLLESAITTKTRAIVPVHYAGVGCEMDAICALARERGLEVVEDAAQGIMASYRGKPLGTWGRMGTLSFHETKNIISGEGGALLLNHPEDISRGEILRDKGTNRKKFQCGEVDKYTWVDIGSSFLPGEIIAAFLWAQLEAAHEIQQARHTRWDYYYKNLGHLENSGLLKRPSIPLHCDHNAHLFYILLAEDIDRDVFLHRLDEKGIHAVFHYVPLHSSPAGKKYGRTATPMKVTDSVASSLVRLPLYNEMTRAEQDTVIGEVENALKGIRK